jgi:hypothetical protein
MKLLIKQLLIKRLNEVHLAKHTFDRAEERVWGNSQLTNGMINNDPPTMNKDAWDQEVKFNKITVPTSQGSKEIPATNPVIDVMSKLNYIQNNIKVDVTLEPDECVTLIIFSSYKEYKGGNIWGSVLTGIIKPEDNEGKMLTIQWQNMNDLSTLRGGKFGTPKYIVSVENLIKNNVKELNDSNIVNLALYPRPKPIAKPQVKPQVKAQPEKSEKYKKIKLINGTEVRYYSNSNKFETLNGESLNTDNIYDLLTPEMQDYIINAMK